MPTYEYACKSCGEHLEVVQSFKDDARTTCPQCEGDLRKVFGSIGIAFKGSGFYKTDSRPAAATSGSSKSEKSESAKSEASGSSSSSESKPAAAKPADSGSSSGTTESKSSAASA
ncbi:MAG: FmdB family transcriptional regulator [Actinobacteria bacterium]|nr:FmdB family transcriptional regulator [Actinomycetota bacterium]